MKGSDSIRYAKGVGPKMMEKFTRLGIETVRDLLLYPPMRYINRNISDSEDIKHNEYTTITGTVMETGETFTRRRKRIFNAVVKSGERYFYAKWFNNRYVGQYVKEGEYIILSGKIDMRGGIGEFIHPEYEVMDSSSRELIHTGRIVPVYSTTAGLSQRYIRKIVYNLIKKDPVSVEDDLPGIIREQYGFPEINESVENLHFPDSEEMLEKSIQRMKYAELFYAGLVLAVRRQRNRKVKEHQYTVSGRLTQKLSDILHFELTDDQKNAVKEIEADMDSRYPMNRLLIGDVGSGKTVVALLSMLHAVENGYQAAIMAPTEILAHQHYRKIQQYLTDMNITVDMLSSSVKNTDDTVKKIESGHTDIIIGTHALLEDYVRFKNLKMIVIDEQHRFGVVQRNKLRTKADDPDYLVMTATPIPRSMTMMIYGDMDSSVLKNKPHDRKPVKTKWVAGSEQNAMYSFTRKLLDRGEKCFVVSPAIDEESKIDVKSVENLYKELLSGPLSKYSIDIVHSRIPAEERDSIMENLKSGKTDVIIGTTVIEVGIDIRDATVMIIHNAERFGLSQLHQLRGRVGRSSRQSYCFLLSGSSVTETGLERLKTIAGTNDGFQIAEKDLRLRGPGEIWGKRQHGMPDFLYADPVGDYELMKRAFSDSADILENDPDLLKLDNRYVKIKLKRRIEDELKEV